MEEYIIWESYAGTKYCPLGVLHGVKDEYEIKRGIPRAHNFPKEAYFAMDKRFPKQVKFSDSLTNGDNFIVVSEKLKTFLATKSLPLLEFLPVSIYDHHEKLDADNYFIVHPTEIIDCIDIDQSTIRWNLIDPTMISSCRRLVLKEEAIDRALLLFRAKFMERVVFVRADLAKAISDAQFTGVDFVDIDSFQR